MFCDFFFTGKLNVHLYKQYLYKNVSNIQNIFPLLS